MIKTGCPNPEIVESLAHCLHGDKVLICTGNLRFNRKHSAKVVYLAVQEGLPTVTQVISALSDTVNFEKAEFMQMPFKENYLQVHQEFLDLLPENIETAYHEKNDFYALTGKDEVALIIVSGDVRTNANVLLTVYL